MAVLGCLIVLWMQFGAPADNNLAPTDAGTRLINQHFPRQSGDTLTLAIRSDHPVTSPAVRERVTSALTPFGRAEHVTAVGSPYQAPGRISADRHIAFATVQFGVKASESPTGEARALMNDARAASGGGVSFYLGGDVIDMAETPEGGPVGGHRPPRRRVMLLIVRLGARDGPADHDRAVRHRHRAVARRGMSATCSRRPTSPPSSRR